LVDLKISDGFDRFGKERPDAAFDCACSQFAVAPDVRTEEINIQRTPIFAEFHDNGRTTAEPALIRREEIAIH
jgi:hypothetical protein